MQTISTQIVIFLIATTFLSLLLVGFIISILYFHQQRSVVFQEQLTNSRLEIQEETFQHISREIHDNITLSLTLAKLNLNCLLSSQPELPKTVQSTIDLISIAIKDLTNISRSLSSEAIKNYGLINVLEGELFKLSESNKYEVDFAVKGLPIFLPSEKEIFLFRIAQEAINNIIKHAKANKIIVTINYDACFIQLMIRDNGVGLSEHIQHSHTPSTRGSGILNMKKRARMINASFDLNSDSGGTTVNVTIPINNE